MGKKKFEFLELPKSYKFTFSFFFFFFVLWFDFLSACVSKKKPSTWFHSEYGLFCLSISGLVVIPRSSGSSRLKSYLKTKRKRHLVSSSSSLPLHLCLESIATSYSIQYSVSQFFLIRGTLARSSRYLVAPKIVK